MPAWVTSTVHEKAIAILVQARKEAGLTQRQLAAKSGKQQSFIAKVERRERNLSLLEFIGLATAIGMPPEELMKRATADLPPQFEF